MSQLHNSDGNVIFPRRSSELGPDRASRNLSVDEVVRGHEFIQVGSFNIEVDKSHITATTNEAHLRYGGELMTKSRDTESVLGDFFEKRRASADQLMIDAAAYQRLDTEKTLIGVVDVNSIGERVEEPVTFAELSPVK